MVLDCVSISALCTFCKPEIIMFDLQNNLRITVQTRQDNQQTIFWLKKRNNRLKHENRPTRSIISSKLFGIWNVKKLILHSNTYGKNVSNLGLQIQTFL